jgi:hypothetical protein
MPAMIETIVTGMSKKLFCQVFFTHYSALGGHAERCYRRGYQPVSVGAEGATLP